MSHKYLESSSDEGFFGDETNSKDDFFELDMTNIEDGEGLEMLFEAHNALGKLHQKTNRRGRVMKKPRRAESWN